MKNSRSFFLINPFWIELSYFIIISLLGFLALKVTNPRNYPSSADNDNLKTIDVFFTSVSAVTVSSMSTVEMENFSNTQLIFMTFLMLLGGEVFTSMLGLQFKKLKRTRIRGRRREEEDDDRDENGNLRRKKIIKWLSYVVFSYLLVIHVVGSFLVYIYTAHIPSARNILKRKGLNLGTFSIFTIVSTFSNCGFIPTNENMIVFKENSGLLLILVPQILLGNTLYPACLRLLIFVLEKITKRDEFRFMLNKKNHRDLGYDDHLLSCRRSSFLAVTVFGFLAVQFVFFCVMEWGSVAMNGLNSYQKLVGSLFEVANSRHTGESIFDLSLISPAILVLFIVMMYLPPYTSFLPNAENEKERRKKEKKKKKKKFLEYVLLSQPSYLAIFIILICITERDKLKDDPLNFNVMNITFEVVSAYANDGFSIGYSCQRRLKPGGNCKDAWYGFVGRWSGEGKLILVLVMLFGRLKKHLMGGGRAWKLT